MKSTPIGPSAASHAALEEYCDQLKRAWASDSRVSIEQLLSNHAPAVGRHELLVHLIQCEMELRRQAGEHPQTAEYTDRFPEIDGSLVDELISLPAPPPPSWNSPALPRRYRVVKEIGQGGIGSVWRVEDRIMQRPLAAKVLLDKFKNNPAANARLEREALLAGSLQHPGIPPVFERGELLTGSKYFTMKLVEGQTLQALLIRDDAAENRQYFLGVFRQIAEAVGFAHSKGVIHRDLKPQNVMVGEFGEVQIMDWGMAKRLGDSPECNVGESDSRKGPRASGQPAQQAIETHSMSLDSSQVTERRDEALTLQGDIFGTPSYMSPEQAQGDQEQLSERSDVFSLGTILFEILTNQRLYQEVATDHVIAAAANCQSADSLQHLETCEADEELVGLCKKCLNSDPNERPASGLQVALAVSNYLSRMEQRLKRAEVEQAASEARVAESRKRMRTTIALVATAALIALIGLSGITWKWREANRNYQESKKQSAAREVYFSKSLAAVDQMLTRVGSEMLANVPQMSQVRRRLLNDALSFYNDLLQDSDNDPDLIREFGRIQKQVGVIHGKLGDHQQAAAAFQRAAETFDDLRQTFPDDILNVLDYCEARNSYALSINEIGQSVDAETVLRGVIGLLDANQPPAGDLEPVRQEDAHWMQVRADAHAFLATVLPSTRNSSAAISELELAREYFEKIPEYQISDAAKLTYADTLEALASYLERINQIPRSIQLRNQAIATINSLLEDMPESPEYRNRLANIQQLLSGILARQGQLSEAAKNLQREIETRRELVDDFPNIPKLKQDFARGLAQYGSVLNSNGNIEQGHQCLTEAVEVAQALVDQFPDTVDYQQELAYVCRTLATASQLAGGQANLELSNVYYQKAYQTCQKIVALSPRNARFQHDLALAARNWSAALVTLGTDDDQARQLLEEAVDIFSRISSAEPENTDYLYQLAFSRLNYSKRLSHSNIALAAATLEEACLTLSTLIELQPQEPRYRLQLTRAYDQLSTLKFQLGTLDAWEISLRQANQIMEEVVEEFGRDSRLIQFLTISKNRLAHCLKTRGKVDESNQLFQSALAYRKAFVDEDPENEKMTRQLASSHANLAWNLAYWQDPERRDLEEALRQATIATQLDSEAAEHWTCLAYLRFRQSQYADVDQVLAQCDAVNQPDQMCRLALQAMTHWKLGDKAAAQTALANAKKLRDSEALQNDFNARLIHAEFFLIVDEADALIDQ